MNKRFAAAFLGFAIAYSLAVSLSQTINVVFSQWSILRPQFAAVDISWILAMVAVAGGATTVLLKSQRLQVGIALCAAGVGGLVVMYRHEGRAAALAVVIGGAALVGGSRLLQRRFREPLARFLDNHPWKSILWICLVLLLVVQSGRLAAYMADDRVDWWLTTRHEFWAKHMCMPAYLHAVDLHRQGETNLYDARHYPTLVRSAKVHLKIKNMEAYAGDAYQYPPQFLLAPRLALYLTNDFLKIRTVWFCLQLFGFVLIAFLLASWVQTEAGWTPFLLIPVVWVSVPVLQSMQFGQFHLAAICLSLGAMFAFAKERHATGGMLLAAATLGKIFPGILILLLVLQRKWRSLIWTAVFGLAFTVATLLVFGSNPFSSFVSYQLPRLVSGQAFDFTRDWPELTDLIVADNISPVGFVAKLSRLGVPGMSEAVGRGAGTVYSLVVLALALFAGRACGSRLAQACLWLALLNLAALQSPAAWGDYVPVGTVWLLSLIPLQSLNASFARKLLLGAGWLFSVSLIGIVPMPFIPDGSLPIAISSIAALVIISVNIAVVLTLERGAESGAVAPRPGAL